MTDLGSLLGTATPTKGGPRKEQHMLNIRGREARDQEEPRRPRVAIYLNGLEDEMAKLVNVPSTSWQRATCQETAKALHAEIVAEFCDVPGTSHFAMERLLVCIEGGQWIDYLIAYSLDRLTRGRDRAFMLGWRLGLAGVTLVTADTEDPLPWTLGSRPK